MRVCRYVVTRVWTGVCVCVQAWSWHRTSSLTVTHVLNWGRVSGWIWSWSFPARLALQFVPWIPRLCLPSARITGRALWLADVYGGAEVPNCGLQTSVTSAWFTKASPQPLKKNLFKKLSMDQQDVSAVKAQSLDLRWEEGTDSWKMSSDLTRALGHGCVSAYPYPPRHTPTHIKNEIKFKTHAHDAPSPNPTSKMKEKKNLK